MTQIRHSLKSVVTLFLFLFVSLNLLFIPTSASADGTVLTTTVEYGPITEAPGFTSIEPWNPVWHDKDSTYLVWVDAKQRAWVTQVTNGKSNTIPVDPSPDYLVQADGHHRFSIGVDKAGYIHITGDMHHYSTFTDSVITPYPTRYQKQLILYWKSKLPNDVSGGFVFEGGSPTTAIPGGGWLIGHFFADNNGELYYTSQVHAFENGLGNNGQMAVGLYRYNVDTSTWTSIGGLIPKTAPTQVNVYPVFYWEDAGSGGGWFQNYEASFKFDSKNRLHFAVTGNTNSTLAGANRILYAYSDDNGKTWKKANGTVIAGLPLRGIDGQANTADVVADSGATATFGATAGLTIDSNMKVGISVNSTWRIWNGTAWTTTSTQNYPNLPSPNTGYRMPDNSLIFQDSNGTKILRSPNLDTAGIGYDYTGYKSFTAIDDYSVKTTGTIYGMALNQDGTESVLKTVINAAPLATNWAEKDIDFLTTPSFGGNAGLLNSVFTITSYGVSLEATQDSFHYLYKKMSGDGSIIARVTVPSNAYLRSGLMMRESLDNNAKNASLLLYPTPNNSQALFSYRSAIAGNTAAVSTVGVSSPYWFRLVRAGNVFTGYGSTDGVTWKQLGQQTIPMNADIYVGMAGTAYSSRWFMQPATFDNITAPADACTNVAPVITLTPASQTAAAGTSLNYAVTVANKNPVACGYTTFNLASVLASGLTGSFDKTSLVVFAQTSASANLKVTSAANTAAGSLSITATTTNATDSSSNASATGSYMVSAPACTHANPTVRLTPASQSVSGGGTASYNVTLTNNDSVGCAISTFNLSMVIPADLEGNFNTNSLSITAGANATATLKVVAAASTPSEKYSVTVNTTNATASGYTNTATATLNVKSDCVLRAPTISISPKTQKISGATVANYVVNVVNNDTTACETRLFRYTSNTSPYSDYLVTYMDPYNVSIAPGQTSTSKLTLTTSKGLVAGTYTNTVVSQNGGSGKAKMVYTP
ncbi:MAG: BNR-4 repeat-containing protein [Gammaproteobacteria bacterium]|nr:BNR-4 repeat-containing protein [Gammaproteobacteria bacterium]